MTTNDPENSAKHKRGNLHINRILRIVIILIAAIGAGSALTIHIAPVITTGGTVEIKESGANSSQSKSSPVNTGGTDKHKTSPGPHRPGNVCTGDEFCTACRNCNACINCHVDGGTCRACSKK